MLKTSVLLLCALAVLAVPFPTTAQNLLPKPRPISLGPGIFATFDAEPEPPLQNPADLKLKVLLLTNGTNVNVRHRLVIDDVHGQYFGYDLTAEPAPDGQFRVAFLPLSAGPEEYLPADFKGTLSRVPLSKYPDPQLVKDGDTIALDLLVSSDGKQKIVDFIRFSSTGAADPPAATSTGEPKDFTVDDGPVNFGPTPFVSINGQKFQGPGMFLANKSGATLWYAFPGEGRYILSLVPHDGFQKAGTIRDNVISFQADGQQYELRMNNPVVGSGGAWNLYVLHDPSYRWETTDAYRLPRNVAPGTPFVLGGIDRIENLLPK